MSVIVIADGRRETIKVTPSTTLAQVLQQVCTKYNYKPEQHKLVKQLNNADVDLGLPFRLSGLTSGQLLMLKRKAAPSGNEKFPVVVQVPSGDRMQGEFPASTTLTEIIAWSQQVIPITDKEKKLQPAIQILNQEFFGERLAQTALQQLGLSSSSATLFRLSYRVISQQQQAAQAQQQAQQALQEQQAQQARQEAQRARQEQIAQEQAQINEQPQSQSQEQVLAQPQETPSQISSQPQSQTEPASASSQPEASLSEEVKPDKMEVEAVRTAPETSREDKMELETPAKTESTSAETSTATPQSEGVTAPSHPVQREPKKQEEKPAPVAIPDDRNVKVLSPAEVHINPKDINLPDDFYNLTPEDIKSARQPKEEDDILKTKAMREKEKMKKMQTYTKATIRIRFPDKVMLQGEFLPTDTTETVMAFVAKSLVKPDTSGFRMSLSRFTRSY
eukprot:TRINITY_DN3979_c0_g1_i1.p1 TRINITY_DN3979_c0_g1~~TRINITY_DN3979_c0_g1_i1.p1  ORF type:complete len:460 (+),score=106.37 TRINITY_DN3979_c0_g1_i1:37-1380(+)